MKLSRASLALLAFQLLIVCSVAGKYLLQRVTCPRVWTRAAAYDPTLFMRGRYLSMRLGVDACGSTLPSAKQAEFPRNVDGSPSATNFAVIGPQDVAFPARITAGRDRLLAVRIPESSDQDAGESVILSKGARCDSARLVEPVAFFIPEHAQDPSWVKPGEELWMEVTVPPKGPPRPLQLALKSNGVWKPLRFR